METVIECINLNATLNKQFLDSNEADIIFDKCKRLQWPPSYTYRRVNITFGEEGMVYTVNIKGNTIHREVQNWDNFQELITIKRKLELVSGLTFNCCAIMRYENEKIIIKKHKDKEMNGNPIYGISVGSTRRLQLSPPTSIKTNPIITKVSRAELLSPVILELNHGSLYTLHPPTNSYWTHEILPEIEHTTTRFSLTFRSVNLLPKIKSPLPKNDSIKISSIKVPGNKISSNKVSNVRMCQAIIKTGMRKGELCGCKIQSKAFELPSSNTVFCKRHMKKPHKTS